MGIYDREYIRREPSGIRLGGSMTMTTKIIIVTVGVFAIQLLTERNGWFNEFFALHPDWIKRPWMAFELLTYGFMHSVDDFKHILFNMLIVWFLGRALEHRYGPREFLAYYLTSIVVAGLTWSTVAMLRDQMAPAWGASGGCAAILVLFAFNWPHQQVLLFFVIPMPVWVVAALAIGFDMYGAAQAQLQPNQVGNIAFEAHLGGAAFALLYYRFDWQLSRFLPSVGSLQKRRRGPKLRVHKPSRSEDENGIDEQVDAILRKIKREGQESLTRKERKLLEDASREYQKKRR